MPHALLHRCFALLYLLAALLLSAPHPSLAQSGRSRPVPMANAAQPPANPAAIDALPGDTDRVLYEAILPEQRDRIYDQTAGRLSRYRISAEITPAEANGPAEITGTLDLRYVNNTGAPLQQLYFRLYPNTPTYNEAVMIVSDGAIAGTPVDLSLSVDDTVLTIPLLEPLPAGRAVDVALSFSAVVPVQPRQTYGIFAVDPESGTIILAHWFPILAGFDELGWSLDPVSRNGDPIFANTALFDVTLSTDGAWQIAATGSEIEASSANGTTARRFVSGPVRDFTIVASDQLQVVRRDVGGITVSSYFEPDHATGGEAVLEYATRALVLFDELLIPYPYRQLSMVEADLFGAGGVEFPQLMLMGSSLYGDDNRRNEHYLEFVTAHEVGHQWFYGLVGNNQHRNAFLDEGLVEYLSTEVYFSAQYGEAEGRRQFGIEVLLWYLQALTSSGDMIVDQPTDDFQSSPSYAVAVYAKGAIGFAEIRKLIGDDAFFSALRAYANEYEFAIGTPTALLNAFESASDQEVAPLWRDWFEAEHGEAFFGPDALRELEVELGLR